MRGAWLIAVLCWGCSSSATNDNQNPSGGGSGTDGGAGTGGVSNGGSGGGGNAGAGNGGSGGIAGSAGASDGGAGTGGDVFCSATNVTINEVSTTGPLGSTDEFIELYNPLDVPFELDGYDLRIAGPAAASMAATVWVAASDSSIAAKGFYVIGGDAFLNADGILTQPISADGGVALYLGTDIVDAVAWGDVEPNHPFLENQAAVNGTSSQSMGRVPDGEDCDDNLMDFVVDDRSPGAPN